MIDLNHLFNDGAGAGWTPPLRFARRSHVILGRGANFRQVRLPEPIREHVKLRVRPIGITDAKAYVRVFHRTHSKPPASGLCAFAVEARGQVHGVAILGRPSSRHLQERGWVEVTRVATNGTRNTCSALLGACAREAKRRGAPVVVTYTLEEEPGTSLVAAGWEFDGFTKGGFWDRDGRVRREREDEIQRKRRWIRRLRTSR